MTTLRLDPAFKQCHVTRAWLVDDRAMLRDENGALHTFPLATLKRYLWPEAFRLSAEPVTFEKPWLFTFGESGYLLDITQE